MLNKRQIFLLLFFIKAAYLIGQTTDNSPYSRFGIGELTDNNFNHSRQMAGLGAAYLDGYHINIVNPASYSYLNATAYDLGIFAKRTWLEDKNTTTKIWSGNLEYISLAFPLRNPINDIYDGAKKDYKLGMAFTLMPHSNVNYNILSNDTIQNLGPILRNYNGTGGTYKFLWGNSIKYKDMSFGVNLGYLFGGISYQKNILYEESTRAFSNLITNEYSVRGFLWNAGFLYSKIVNKKQLEANKIAPVKRISLGIHANSATSFSTTGTYFDRLVQGLQINSPIVDTIIFNDSLTNNRGRLPAEIGLGLIYYNGEKAAIGFNFTSAFWANYFNEASGEKVGSLRNSFKASVGGYYRPNYKSFTSFFKRVYYRYGVYYNADPRVVYDEQITSYGVTAGLGMPFVFQRKVSHINVGVNLGMRGQNTPLSEKYVKISFGVTFNDDEWFLKRKYN